MRIDLRRAIVVDAEARWRRRAGSSARRRRRSRQVEERRLALQALEVDRERPLVAVEREEGDVDLVAARPAGRDVSLPFARDRLHFDDVRAEVAEALRGERAGHGDRAVENPVAGKNAHKLASLLRKLGPAAL